MKEWLKSTSRSAMLRAGAQSARSARWSTTAARYTALGRWAAQWGPLPPEHRDRFQLFAAIVPELRAAETPLYLEFGVYKGDTLRWWSEQVTAPTGRFVGFDSFEGLPEAWDTAQLPGGAFSVEEPPTFEDQRVRVVEGWFSETLPEFELPAHDRLVVSVDSDLYSSATTVLEKVGPHLRSGDFVYFDELADLDHEFRALTEFVRATDIELVPWGFSGGGVQWMLRVN